MRFHRAAPALLFVLVAACESTPETPATPPPPPATAEPPPPPAPPPPPPEPTAEEKKKAEAQKQMQEYRVETETNAKAEAARWTPELHAEAKALAEKAYPSPKAAIQAALAGKHRKPGDVERDKHRHPVETLTFFGLKPTMTVLEFGPGEGWFTRVLAPVLAKKGKLVITTSDPNGPPDQFGTLAGQRFKGFLDTSPELYGKVEPLVIDQKAPKIGREGDVDMIVLTRELHGMVNRDTLDAWLGEFHKALKPNGVVGVEQHRAKPEADPKESSKKGYLPEKFVIEKFQAAGFKLGGKSEVNANPKDTKDYPEGVWTLPPSFELKDKDREKYAAIGESDRMTLKFVKVAKAEKKVAAVPAAGSTPGPTTPAKN
jgi:predicted methyltransferase